MTQPLKMKETSTSKKSSREAVSCEICILAGGKSSRMGRNKANMRLGGRTLLGQIRYIAKKTGLPVRVIRRDFISSCGPLGGIDAALQTTSTEAVLFLACDMPFLSIPFLERILKQYSTARRPLFVLTERGVGFPFLLDGAAATIVKEQLAAQNYSLQLLAQNLKADFIIPTKAEASQLFNVNTPEDWTKALQLFRD